MKVLVTGAAGFIGSALSQALLDRGDEVVGLDNLNDYYDVSLKEARLARLTALPGFRFVRADIADRAAMRGLFAGERYDCVVNLAAQAGVRYSLVNPHAYVDANITGFLNILEGVRHHGRPGRLCLVELGVRGKHAAAVSRDRLRRPPRVPLRGHQARQRADGAFLRAPLRRARHGAPVLHGVRPVGTPGHGASSSSRGESWPAIPSPCSTRATWCAISPTSTTSSKGWCA